MSPPRAASSPSSTTSPVAPDWSLPSCPGRQTPSAPAAAAGGMAVEPRRCSTSASSASSATTSRPGRGDTANRRCSARLALGTPAAPPRRARSPPCASWSAAGPDTCGRPPPPRSAAAGTWPGWAPTPDPSSHLSQPASSNYQADRGRHRRGRHDTATTVSSRSHTCSSPSLIRARDQLQDWRPVMAHWVQGRPWVTSTRTASLRAVHRVRPDLSAGVGYGGRPSLRSRPGQRKR